jgi:hypothetical protein
MSDVRPALRDLEIAFDMAVHGPFELGWTHEPFELGWTLDIHQRTLDAIIACDMELIDPVMDERLARVEHVGSGRPAARSCASCRISSAR